MPPFRCRVICPEFTVFVRLSRRAPTASLHNNAGKINASAARVNEVLNRRPRQEKSSGAESLRAPLDEGASSPVVNRNDSMLPFF